MEMLHDRTHGIVVLDFRGTGNTGWNDLLRQGADALVMPAGELFSEISMAAIASCQWREIAGQPALVVTQVVRDTVTLDETGNIEPGVLVMSKITIRTPFNRQHKSNTIMLVNFVASTPENAEKMYLELVTAMENEAPKPAKTASRPSKVRRYS